MGIDGGGTKSKTGPQQGSQEANPKIQATTLENKGVAAPSLRARALGQERFDLLQLRLEHALDMLALLVNLG